MRVFAGPAGVQVCLARDQQLIKTPTQKLRDCADVKVLVSFCVIYLF